MVMEFYLIFKNSGDVLTLDAIQPDVVEYYIERLEATCGNDFALQTKMDVKELIDSLIATEEEVNEEVDYDVFPIWFQNGYLDQDNLNWLHDYWANGTDEHIPEWFQGEEARSQVNVRLHKIEEAFNKMRFANYHKALPNAVNGVWECPSIFDRTISSNDQVGLSLPPDILGRTRYNKFANFDVNYEYGDENNFAELPGTIDISFKNPETIAFSPEYLAWCKQHKIEPKGHLVPMGNFQNLTDRLTDYRIIMHRNIRDKNNFELKVQA